MYLANIILPYDTNAESGVVCTLIMNPEFIGVHNSLKANHFYNRELASVFWAIQELTLNGVYEIDALNLSVKLNEKKGVRKIIDTYGGDKFLKDLTENAPVISRNTHEEYLSLAKRITELGFRRKLYGYLQTFESQCLNEEESLAKINSDILSGIDTIAQDYISNEKVLLYGERLDTILSEMEKDRAKSKDGMVGLPTSWKLLTDRVRYEDGDLYLFASRRKGGKSILLTTEALNKAKSGLSVAMFSTEMSDKKDTIRILAMLSGIPIRDIKSGNIHDYDEQKYLDAIHFLKHAKFTREYKSDWTRETLKLELQRIKNQFGGLDFFVHDYIKDPKSSESSQKYNELGKWTDFLKNHIAGDFKIPVLSAVQLNRQNEVADSDLIERYSSCGIKWIPKTREEILTDGEDSGNYKMNIFFSRDGGHMDEEEYFDFYMDTENTANLRVYEAKKQHDDALAMFNE